MSTSERSKGNRIAIRRVKSTGNKTGELFVTQPIRPSPHDIMWEKTINEIQTTVPDFNLHIEPYMYILFDFWNTRTRISMGADFKSEMLQFLDRNPVMNSENDISKKLSPATTLIRDKLARQAKIRK